MTVSKKIFHSKVLLFGEHILNVGAMGLAVPFTTYGGMFQKLNADDAAATESNQALQQLAEHIMYHDKLANLYDTNQLLTDIEDGVYFDSDVPMGYGLGSSGALVAAIFHQYRKKKLKNFPIADLKEELGWLESCFHGKSSGLDPLVCYLNRPILIKSPTDCKAVTLHPNSEKTLAVFLINTNIARNTAPLVQHFMKRCEDSKFLTSVQKTLVPTNFHCIDSFMKGRMTEVYKSVKLLSQLQLDLVPELIPQSFHELWKTGLKYNEYYLKICGAGGGGFLLGFSPMQTNIRQLIPDYPILDLMTV